MQFTSIQAHPGAANQSQIKFDSRDCRVGAELPWSCEAPQKAQRHPLWYWPELKLLRAHIWKWGHGLPDTHSFVRLHECLQRTRRLAFAWLMVLFHFMFFHISQTEEIAVTERGIHRCALSQPRGCVLPQNELSSSKDPTWIHTTGLQPCAHLVLCSSYTHRFLSRANSILEEPQLLLLNESALFQNVSLHSSILEAIYFQALYPKVKGRKGLTGINNHLKSRVSEEAH